MITGILVTTMKLTLRNRPNLNRVSDFLRDYYKSIDMLDFDSLMPKIMNSLTDFIDISGGLSTSDKEEQTKIRKNNTENLRFVF